MGRGGVAVGEACRAEFSSTLAACGRLGLESATPLVVNKKNLGIRNLDPEMEVGADVQKTLEFAQTKKFARSGQDLPDF